MTSLQRRVQKLERSGSGAVETRLVMVIAPAGEKTTPDEERHADALAAANRGPVMLVDLMKVRAALANAQ
jgi:hypothetical protein